MDDSTAKWLHGLPVFAQVPSGPIEDLAALLEPRIYPAGSTVVAQGDRADRWGVVTAGQAEVAVASSGGKVTVAMLGPGDVFGESAALEEDGVRKATITAVGDLSTFEVTSARFDEYSESNPRAKQLLAELSITVARSNLLRQASPFRALTDGQRRDLISRMTVRSVEPRTDIVCQGEEGSSCFVIEAGEAEVLIQQNGQVREMSRLTTGDVFGEAALLTTQPRNATVRALTACQLLEISREDLLDVVESTIGEESLVKLMRLRERPIRKSGVTVHEGGSSDGRVFVLKDEERRTYFRLSEQGWFVWERLDGGHNLRDIALEYHETLGAFVPLAMGDTIAALAEAGFVERAPIAGDVARRSGDLVGWKRLAQKAKGILEYEAAWVGVDWLWAGIYRWFGWLFFKPVVQVLMLVVTLCGLGALLAVAPGRLQLAATTGAGWMILVLPVAYTVALVCHEAGHALTAKHFGREINRIGVGWYWFGPIAFIDTSDLWLANRRQRILTSLAGPYADMFLAGLVSLVAIGLGDHTGADILWHFVLVTYLTVLINLNPLLEFDGYYVLIDWLDRPNLRPQALKWLGANLPSLVWRPRELGNVRAEVLYSLAVVAYVPIAAILSLIVYRRLLEGWIAYVLPTEQAAAVAWVLVVGGLGLAVLALAGELRGVKRERAA